MRVIRHIPEPRQLREITCRINHGQLLLRPGRKLNRIILGLLGRAQEMTGMRICAYAFLSSHFHLILQPGNAERLSDFMEYFNGNLSKEVGRLYGIKGPKFQRRYTDIPISDEPMAQIDRLRYLLSNSAKEGLVASPLKWPGAHSARAMVFGTNDFGTWFDRTQERTARNQGRGSQKQKARTNYEIFLTPIPCWAHYQDQEYRQRVLDMIRAIEKDTLAMHREKGTQPLGKKAILTADPLHIPGNLSYSEAPPIHGRSKEMRKIYFEAYHSFLSAYRKAADLLKDGVPNVKFPEGCFPPGLPFVRGPDFTI